MAVVYLPFLVKKGNKEARKRRRDFSVERFGLGVRAFKMCS